MSYVIYAMKFGKQEQEHTEKSRTQYIKLDG